MPKQWIEDANEIAEFLAQAPVGRLATCRDGRPYLVPVSFVYHDGRFYVHSGPTGRKMDNLRANPRVCFEVDQLDRVRVGHDSCSHSMRYTSVIAHGRATLLADEGLKRQALGWLVAKYTPGEPATEISAHALAGVEVIEIVVDELTAKRA